MVVEPRPTLRTGFFKSFSAYDIPLRPQGPISFEDTKDLSSYCLAQFQEDGQIASFTKIILERQACGELPWPARLEPGSVVFFEAAPGEEPQQVAYADTQNRDSYCQAVVSSSGHALSWELLLRKPLFRETYAYRPDGGLKERVVYRSDGRVLRWLYDEKGQAVLSGE